jgi:tetratricopeptide (TPR) repeat protein
VADSARTDSATQLTREIMAAQADPRRQLGRYLLLSELGRGSFGSVMRAWDPQMGRLVAVKLLGGLTQRAQIRFRREIQAMAGLRHPHIAAAFDSGEHAGQPYLVMDYLAGGSAAERLKSGPLQPQEAAGVVRDVASAVHAAHQQGTLHRDIKPDNVLFNERGQPVLVDFGLATLVGDSKITRDGAALGTPSYMAPEQAVGRHEDVDQRSDVYALGATLFHLLVGRPPFVGETLQDVSHKVVEVPAAFPDDAAGVVDARLQAICLKCLEKARDERYATAEALAADLDRYLSGGLVEAFPESSSRVGLALGLLLVVAVVGGALLATRGGEAPSASPVQTETPATTRAQLSDEELRQRTDDALALLDERARALAPWPELAEIVSAAAEAIERAPFRHELRLAHAALAQRRGRFGLAEELAGEVAEEAAGALRDQAQASQADALAAQGEEGRCRALRREVATRDAQGKLGLTAEAANRLARGDVAGSIEKLELACQEDPDYAPALRLLAEALAETEPAQSLASLESARERLPDDVCTWLAWGRARLRVDPLDLAVAREAAAKAAELCDPEDPPALLRVFEAELALREGRPDEALERLELALRRGALARALVLRGMVQDNEDDWRQAYASNRFRFSALVRELPGWERWRACEAAEVEDLAVCAGQLRLAWLSPRLGERLAARARAVPQRAREPLERALLAAAKGSPWSAIKDDLRAAQVAEPESAPLALEAVRLLVGRDQSAAALEAIEQARELLPEAGPELTRWEAEVQIRDGRLSRARQLFQAAALTADSAQAAVAAAEVALLDRDFEEALRRAEAALGEAPELPAALLVKAVALRCLGRPREGLAVSTRALAVEGALNARLLMMRALCYAEALLGRSEPTVGQLRSALAPFDQLRQVTDGVSGRLLAANFAFRHVDTHGVAGEYLQEARLLQPDRAETYVLLGVFGVVSGERKGQVLKHWRRAGELEPGWEVPQGYAEQFEARFGEPPQLD